MRHSLIMKFIAVFLCAVSLLTAIGSALGMLVLTELNLYNKTVEQVIDQRVLESSQSFARAEALRYASMTLGGCPEGMVQQAYPNYDDFYDRGITIVDAEGTVLHQEGLSSSDASRTDSFPISGQYMYLLSETPDAGQHPSATEPTASVIWAEEGPSPLQGAYGLYDAIPAGTVVSVYGITIGYSDDSSEGYASVNSFGVLFRDAQGRAVFQSTEPHVLNMTDPPLSITYIAFRDQNGTTVYEASGLAAVGTATYDLDAYVTFVANATVSDPHAAQNIYRAEFFSVSNPETVCFQVSAQTPIGIMEYDEEGYLHILIDSLRDPSVSAKGSFPEFSISRITLYDVGGRKLLDHQGPGTVTTGADLFTLQYRSDMPVLSLPAAAAETVPLTPEPPQTTAPTEAASTEETSSQETTAVTTEATENTETTEATLPVETTAAMETMPPETTVPETVPTETAPPVTVPPTAPAAPTMPEVTAPAATEPILINGKPLTDFGISTMSYYNHQTGERMQASYVYLPLPEYTVQVHVADPTANYGAALSLLLFLRNIRSDLFLFLGISLLLFAIFAVYLCWSAGHGAKTAEVRAGGLNRMPLDLYLILGGSGVAVLVVLIAFGIVELLSESLEVFCALTVVCGFLSSLIIVGFLFAIVAQGKTPGGYLWRNTIFGRCLNFCFRCMIWLKKWITRNARRFVMGIWSLIAGILGFICRTIAKFFGWLGSLLRRFLSLLPLTWQWVLGGMVLLLLCVLSWANRNDVWGFLWLGLALALVLYISHCFGILLEGVKRMSKGDLDSKVEDKRMVGCFQEFAGDLNDLADVAVVAAQKQLKSERMKTELITNVSHDIKTPLTSIINYVDLLQKPHTEAEGQDYLEVLDRQSQRLKKLIEDLMDMSKANTGNMSVDITRLDAVESINQALGEFADKLDKVQLIPVFRHTEEDAMIMADGRLVWRVLSNLLSNAVKYAMPGTRLYVDLMKLEGKVVVSMKNISRDELSMDAEELMERFVRGDDSRNSEGSGLGLNIAKSLMELQKGQLQLLVDGDLFKVTLIFPGA